MKTAIYLCKCGSLIADNLDLSRVAERVRLAHPGAYVQEIEYACSEEGRGAILADLQREKPERVVVAACSPREHETTFMAILKEADINPFLVQMANIREHAAWVTLDIETASEKALHAIYAAIARVALHEPLEQKEVYASPDILVLGGGPAGLSAARSLAASGRRVVLVEKSSDLGGVPARIDTLSTGECGSCVMNPLIDEVLYGGAADRIEALTQAELKEVKGFFGAFKAVIVQGTLELPVREFGGIIIAVGGSYPENGEHKALPSPDTEKLAKLLYLPLDNGGYFRQLHPMMEPVRSIVRGIYLAGACTSHYGIREAVIQGLAAASAAAADLVVGMPVELETATAEIDGNLCSGCHVCLTVCPYQAIGIEEDNKCSVNELLCCGCGNCAASCPTGAIRQKQYTRAQVEAEIMGGVNGHSL